MARLYFHQVSTLVEAASDEHDLTHFGRLLNEFTNSIERLSSANLFRVASAPNPDTEWQGRNLSERKESDGPHMFIDLLINLFGYTASTGNGFNGCFPFPIEMHRRYEEFLMQQFIRCPAMVDLMHIGGELNDDPMQIERHNYHSGLNWRMTNLIFAGFFGLYQCIIRIRNTVQIGHLFLFIKLATSGTDGSSAYPRMFIPDVYAAQVENVIQTLSNRFLLENGQTILSSIYNRGMPYIVDFHPYEYCIFVPESRSDDDIDREVRCRQRLDLAIPDGVSRPFLITTARILELCGFS